MGHKRKQKQKQRAATQKSNNNVDDHQQNLPISQFSNLSISLEADDDLPHPRHLCFRFPFPLTSHHLHCIKCYCYVCEEVAPCKHWTNPQNEHCHATQEIEIWKTERKNRKKVSGTNITMAHHILTVSFMQDPPDQPNLINGYAGGLICDSNGEWVAGFSRHMYDVIGSLDASVLPLLTLIEGLKLSWAKGLRFLEVRVGFQYHDGFWQDFDKFAASGKYRLLPDATSPGNEHRVWTVLREVVNCLNQDWFINVRNTASHLEESGAVAMGLLAQIKPDKQVYDFPSHPLTAVFKDLAEFVAKNPEYCQGNPDCEDALKAYVGLAS